MWLLVVLVLALLAWWVLKGVARGGPPGPWGLPLLGHLPLLDPERPHESLARLSRRHGPVFALNLGRVRTVVLADAALIRRALNADACAGRAPLYLTHGIMHGYGLICAEGVRWKEHRRFTTAALKSMGMVKFGGNRDALAARVFQGAQRLVDEIGRAPPAPMDAAPLLNHCLGSLVYALVFGKQFERDDPTWLWLQHLQEEGTRMIGVAGPLNFLPWLRFVPKLRRTITFLLEGKNKSHELYRKLLQQHVDSGLQDGDSHLAGRYLKEVALRVRAGDLGTFTEPQMLHSLADVFGAGFDTTNATLKWFLLFMALHPDVQQRVKSELDAAVFSRPEGERNLRMSDLPCCPYTEAAIAETQRLRSVVPTGIPHGATQDVEIGGFRIAAGTMIMPLQWAVHTDPKLWGSDVDSFNPDRFLTPEGRVSKPDYFMPFQSGKRVCLGEELARMMVFAFAASVVFNFRVSFGGGQDAAAVLQGDCGITLNPKAHNLLFEPHLL